MSQKSDKLQKRSRYLVESDSDLRSEIFCFSGKIRINQNREK